MKHLYGTPLQLIDSDDMLYFAPTPYVNNIHYNTTKVYDDIELTKMIISLIAALDNNRLIGANNRLPWHLPADLAYFRRTTMNKPILMGRFTFESFGAKPLPGRKNIILTQNTGFQAPECTVVHSIDQALAAAAPAPEAMILGGASFYQQMLPLAQRLYLTFVDGEFEGDTWFPEYTLNNWQEISSVEHPADDKNPYPYRFVVLEKREDIIHFVENK